MTIVTANQYVPVASMSTSSSKKVLQDSEDLSSPPPPSKKRRAVTDAEQKALRDYYFDPKNNKSPHKQLRR